MIERAVGNRFIRWCALTNDEDDARNNFVTSPKVPYKARLLLQRCSLAYALSLFHCAGVRERECVMVRANRIQISYAYDLLLVFRIFICSSVRFLFRSWGDIEH